MQTTTVDWRTLSPHTAAALYAAEVRRWSSQFEWDTALQWEAVERERQLGTAPGVAVLDATGKIVLGWSAYRIRGHVLEIRSLSTDSDPVAETLLRVVLNQAPAGIERVSMCVLSEAAHLAQTARALGMAVDRYWHLGRHLQRSSPSGLPDLRAWRVEDREATAELLSRAYTTNTPDTESRPFAPGGTPGEWAAYVTDVTRGGCGSLLPDGSLCITAGPGRLTAVALVTRISDGTAHLAQLAVDPQLQRRRVGAQLVELACAAAARSGCRRITVQVGGTNRPARSLFEGSQFAMLGSVLVAGRRQPRRSTSVAPGGAVITRR